MSQNTTAQTWLAWIQGEVVSYADMLALQSALQSIVGSGIATQQGTLNALPLLQPLAIATNGTMAISLGGSNQRVLTDGYLCDGCPAQSLTVPTAPASGTRVDVIAVQNAMINAGSVNRKVETAPGTFATETITTQNFGVAYKYIEGTTGGGAPSAPAGWNAFATITVAAGTVAIVAADIAYLFPEMNPAGPPGPKGDTGGPGAAVPPFTTTTVAATVPAVNAAVTLAASSGAAFPSQMDVYVVSADGTQKFYGTITSGGLTANLTITCSQIVAGTAGAALPAGATVMVSGPPGIQGLQGIQGNEGLQGPQGNPGQNSTVPGPAGPGAIAHTNAGVVMPAVGSNVSVPVDLPAGYPFATYVILSDGATAFYGQVTAGGSSPLTVQNLGVIAGSVGATIASGATLTFSGPPSFQISVGGTAVNDGNGGNASIALPAYGSWFVEVVYGVSQSNNVNYSVDLYVASGSVTSFGSNASGNTSFNAQNVITMYGKCRASGGQTVTFGLTTSGGAFIASPAQPWTVRATRTA